MAPHDTNTRREARRHWFPLAGMAVVVALVVLGFFWWVAEEVTGDGEPVPGQDPTQEEAVETYEPQVPPPVQTPEVDTPPADAPPLDPQ